MIKYVGGRPGIHVRADRRAKGCRIVSERGGERLKKGVTDGRAYGE
jgi:hypothetical protein